MEKKPNRSRRVAIIAGLVIVVAVSVAFMVMQGPDLASYEPLREPRITNKEDQRMLVVEAKGDPNQVAPQAFALLFKTYYRLDGVPKGLHQPVPRGRWSGIGQVRSSWIGQYALPVPDSVTGLPPGEAEQGFKVSLSTWEYGTVAEILHIGPYNRERPSIEKLGKFIEEQGYEAMDTHEEEYVSGPGKFLRGDADKYYTIIRYRVVKR